MGFGGFGWWHSLGSDSPKPKVTWQLLRRVLTYARPYRLKIAIMLVLILVTTGLTLVTPLGMRDLIDRTIPAKDLNRLILLAIALLILPVFGGAVRVIQRRLNASIGEGVIFDLRVALFSRLQRMSLHFFTHTKVGELMSRLNNDVIGAQNAISNTIVDLITNIITTAAVLSVMLTLEWRLTLVSIVILPLFIITAQKLSDRLREIARAHMEANARMNALANETLNISGALLVKLFGRVDVEVNRFSNRASQVRDIGVNRAVTGSTFFMIIGLISAIGTAFIFGFGGYLVIRDVFTIGTIVAFGAYLGTLYGALSDLASAPVEFATSVVSFERVFEIIDMPFDIAEQENAVELTRVEGNLTFDNVSFQYDDRTDNLLSEVKRIGHVDTMPVLSADNKNGPSEEEENRMAQMRNQAREAALSGINFHVDAGKLVALVGPSGAGKTTLSYLIPRMYDPTSGRILIDGIDIRHVTLESLSRQIGLVTQETHLFHDTVRTNLLYARLDATREELEAAATAANIHHFITALPDGYDTIVGERGYRLSGGEKQRLALARVILKDPRILVLDEATSHLDSESEALIQEALSRVMAGRTSIVIAHRLSTILAADLILVMDRGRIVESGVHDDLLKLNGLYSNLYHTQFGALEAVNDSK